MEKICETCRFAEAINAHYDNAPPRHIRIECHRHAPRRRGFPTVKEDWWCGEHEEKYPQHSRDCGTKYRGCAPDCAFDKRFGKGETKSVKSETGEGNEIGPTVSLEPGSPNGGPYGWTTTLRGGSRTISTTAEQELWRWWSTLKSYIKRRGCFFAEAALRDELLDLMSKTERE